MTHPLEEHANLLSRRALFQNASLGLGGIALASMLAEDGRGAPTESRPSSGIVPHFAPRAKNVIFLHMVGAPSHLDLFEYKPQLSQTFGND